MQAVADAREHERASDDSLTLALHEYDPRWISDAFDAIVSAEWAEPALSPPRLHSAVATHPAGSRGARTPDPAAYPVVPWLASGSGTESWVRERSPPRTCAVPVQT